MKKSELNSTTKAEIKKIQKEIEISLISKLKTITGKLGEGTDKLEKEIEKGSKKLAKKVVKELKVADQPVAVIEVPKAKTTNTAEPKAQKKAAPKSPVSKQVKPAPEKQPAKTTAAKSKTAQPVKKG